MDALEALLILLIGVTAFWAYLMLKQRIDFLEHEVRWLKKELESLKPTEVRSVQD